MKMIDRRNDLLKRREIQLAMSSENNPGLEQARKFLAEKLKHPEEHIAIKSLKNNFGTNEFLIEALAYDSKEDKERIEPKPKIKKKAGEGN